MTKNEAEGLVRRGVVDAAWHVASETKDKRRFFAPGVAALVDALKVAREAARLAADVAWSKFVAELDDALSAPLRAVFGAVAEIDALRALGRSGGEPGWCWPDVSEGAALELKDFAHPTLAPADPEAGGALVPNDVRMDVGGCVVLTGPNTGGKSSVGAPGGDQKLRGRLVRTEHYSADESKPPPRLQRGHSAETGRGGAAAATWIFPKRPRVRNVPTGC